MFNISFSASSEECADLPVRYLVFLCFSLDLISLRHCADLPCGYLVLCFIASMSLYESTQTSLFGISCLLSRTHLFVTVPRPFCSSISFVIILSIVSCSVSPFLFSLDLGIWFTITWKDREGYAEQKGAGHLGHPLDKEVRT